MLSTSMLGPSVVSCCDTGSALLLFLCFFKLGRHDQQWISRGSAVSGCVAFAFVVQDLLETLPMGEAGELATALRRWTVF